MPSTPWAIIDCQECGTGRVDPEPSAQEIAAFYPDSYYGSTGNKFRGVIEAFVRFVAARQARFLANGLAPGARVLDVGCGRGVLLSALADRKLEVHGTELSDAAVYGVDPRAKIRVCSRLHEAAYPDNFFDEIIVWHVLEHLVNPELTITEAHRILKPGGRLIISVPNYSSWQARLFGAAWFHLDPPRHLTHFTLAGLTRILGDRNFELQSQHHFSLRQNPFGWIQSLLNLCPMWPRNALYCLLQKGQQAPASFAVAMTLRGLAALLTPLALVISVLAAICRRGATVHLVSRANKTAS